MECSIDPENLLISAYTERNIPYKRDQIQSALSGCDHTWLSEHLSYDTLLTRDELTLYAQLKAFASHRNIISNADIKATRPLLDDDIQGAIDSLNASTAAAGKQAEVLRSQFQGLSKCFDLEDARWPSNSHVAGLQRKHAVGWQNASTAASDFIHDFEGNLKRESDNANVESKGILSWLARRLKEDDGKLASLAELVSGIKPTGDELSIMKKASQLNEALVEYTAEELCCRLDRLYLDAIRTSDLNSDNLLINKDEAMATLEENLESLYLEIDVLAQMSTNQQFNEPILRELQKQRGHERNVSHNILKYVLNMFIDITSSTEGLTRSLQNRQSFYETLKLLTTLYQTETHVQSVKQSSSKREDSSSEEKSSIHLTELQALEGLFRRFHLSSELTSEKLDGGARSLYEKKLHMRGCLRSLDVAANSTLGPELLCTDSADQLLFSSLDSNSYFKTSLSNVDQGKWLSTLETQLESVRRGTENLNLSVLYQRDRNQKSFLDRWN